MLWSSKNYGMWDSKWCTGFWFLEFVFGDAVATHEVSTDLENEMKREIQALRKKVDNMEQMLREMYLSPCN